MRRWRRLLVLFILSLLLVLLLMAGTNVWVVVSTRDRVYRSPDALPRYEAALVLGTSSRLMNGEPNPFFVHRMEKAAQLYKNGKVTRFILSGDNRTRYYDEPGTMRKVLVEKGVPAGVIDLDAAGLRTFDSIERSKIVFCKKSLVVVTQPFHAYRALFICDHLGIPAVVLAAREPDETVGPQVYIREFFARTRAVLDIYILGKARTV